MSTVTATLIDGQTLTVGAASSREAYEVEVSSGVVGNTGVGVVSANVVGGMLNITLSNSAVINAGSVMTSANTGTITFNGNTIGQLNNTGISIAINDKEWTFGDDGTFSIPGAIYANGTVGTSGQVLTSNGTAAFWSTVSGDGTPYDPSTITSTTNTAVTINIPFTDPSASPAINTTSTWTFNPNGSLEFPDSTVQTTAYTGATPMSQLVAGDQAVTLDTSGTLNTPLLLPRMFTAVLDTDHMVYAIGLTDAPWQYTVEFAVNPDGTINVQMDDPVFLSNPGYVNEQAFEYTEADHGIPGYTFTLALDNITNEGRIGWVASVIVGQPPVYPSTINTSGAIKLTSNDNSWVLGTDGNITFPDSTVQSTAYTGPTIPQYISSGPTAPGSSVVANIANVSINFSDGGSGKYVFNSNGTLQLAAGGDIVDSSGNSVLGGGAAVVSRTVNFPTGELGDTAGTLANDNGTLYFCTADFNAPETSTYSATTNEEYSTGQSSEQHTIFVVSGPANPEVYQQIQNNGLVPGDWTVTIDGYGLSGTFDVVDLTSSQITESNAWTGDVSYWFDIGFQSAPFIIPTGTTFTLTYTPSNVAIWIQVNVTGAPAELQDSIAGNKLLIAPSGDIILTDVVGTLTQASGGGVDRGLVWDYGGTNGGVDSTISQSNTGLTVRSYSDFDFYPTGSPINIQPGEATPWVFGSDGSITFPDSTVQTTAYTGGSSTGYVLNIGDINNLITELRVVTIDSTTGDAYYCGHTTGVNPMDSPTVIKVDSNGSVVWQTTLDFPGTITSAMFFGGQIAVTYIETDNSPTNYSGSVFLNDDGTIANSFYFDQGTDTVVIRDSVLGLIENTPAWDSQVGLVNRGGANEALIITEGITTGFAYTIAEDEAGAGNFEYYGTTTNPDNSDIYAVGESAHYGAIVSYFTSDSTVVWHKDISLGAQYIRATSVAYSNGFIYVTSNNTDTGNDGFLTKLNATTGAIEWQQGLGYGVSNNNDPMGIWDGCVTIDGSGNIVTAWNHGSIISRWSDMLIIKFDTDGNMLWQRSIGTDVDDFTNVALSTEFLTAGTDHYYLAMSAQRDNNGYGTGGAIQLPLDGSGIGTYGIWLYRTESWGVYSQDISAGSTDVTANLIATAFNNNNPGDSRGYDLTELPTSINLIGGGITTGDITFAGVKIIGAGSASGDGYGYGTIQLVPDSSLYGYDQYLIIDPTFPQHIHIRAGGAQDASTARLILGGEETNVTVVDNDREVSINTYNGSNTNYNWNFGNTGILTLPNSNYLETSNSSLSVGSQGTVTIRSNAADSLTTKSWTFGTDGTTTFPDTLITTGGDIALASKPIGHYTFPLAYFETGNGGVNGDFGPDARNGQYFACNVEAHPDGTYTTTVTNPGNSFYQGFYFTVLGEDLGGVTPTNNLTITVDTVDVGGVILTVVSTGTAVGKQWTFGTTGDLTLPAGGDIKNSSGASVLTAVTGQQTYNFDGINTTLTVTNLDFNLLFCQPAFGYAGSDTHTVDLPAGTAGQRLVIINSSSLCGLVISGSNLDFPMAVDPSTNAELIYVVGTGITGWYSLYGTVPAI